MGNLTTATRYSITFNKDILLEPLGGVSEKRWRAGEVTTIDPKQYQILITGAMIEGKSCQGHGIFLGYQWSLSDVAEIVKIEEVETVIYKNE